MTRTHWLALVTWQALVWLPITEALPLGWRFFLTALAIGQGALALDGVAAWLARKLIPVETDDGKA